VVEIYVSLVVGISRASIAPFTRLCKLQKVDPRRSAVIRIFRECAIAQDEAAVTFRLNHAVDEPPATEAPNDDSTP